MTDIADLPEAGKRLRRLRLERGYRAMKPLCAAMGVSHNTYNQHENGIRGLSVETALVYARFFDVSASWLLFGEQARATPMVLVVGSVGQGGWVRHARYKTVGGDPETYRLDLLARRRPAGHYRAPRFAHAPPGVARETALDMAAVEVTADDLSPHYCRGDVIFYQPVEIEPQVARETVDNRRCMVLTVHDELRPGLVHIDDDDAVLLSASGLGFEATDLGEPKAVWPITGIMCRPTLYA